MDLPNLTNYSEHPTEPDWLVFRFKSTEQADGFVRLLQEEELRFEQDRSEGPPFLVAVRSRHRSAAVRLNYIVLGQHRKPFMADAIFRWSVIGFVAALIVIAFLGWLSSR